VGPRIGLDDVERRKLLPLKGIELLSFCCPTLASRLYGLRYPWMDRIKILDMKINIRFITDHYTDSSVKFRPVP
jgi:hypothetical protein